MSHEIPVFYGAIDDVIVRGELTIDEAFAMLPNDPWVSTSRNWWYQGLVAELLDAYAGFDELKYIQQSISLLHLDQVHETANAVFRLLAAIEVNAQPFCACSSADGSTIQQTLQSLSEAKILRKLNDDCIYAYGNFFSFLVSQAAALSEAAENKQAFLYVRPNP